MNIEKSEAAAALAAAGDSERRSFSLYNYRFNAPMLMLWGVMWLAADLTMAYTPWKIGQWAWPAASAIGSIICVAYYWNYARNRTRVTKTAQSTIYFWRMLGTWAFTGMFVVAVMYVFAPFKWREPHAFWGLLIALLYAINGIWVGWRLTLLGIALGALTLFGFYHIANRDFLPFMGVICGGGMILGGVWLRTA